MTRRYRAAAQVQQGLLDLLRPHSRRFAEQPGERARPRLAEIGRTSTGRPVPEIVDALAAAVREVGAEPDLRALNEFARDISEGSNPFE
jgi:hypothetical protein